MSILNQLKVLNSKASGGAVDKFNSKISNWVNCIDNGENIKQERIYE